MTKLGARSRRGCFPLLQRGLAAVLRRNVPVPDASPEAESGGAGRPGALAGRVRRAAALVFCASLAAPLLGAGGSAEAQNTPATGAPTITGTATVGQTLTAGITAIMDADGLTAVQAIGLYKFQWIRVATDNSETNIASATTTYTLVAADQGTTIKSFS